MFLSQEPKYMAHGSQILNRATRQPIPSKEPVFLFRAKDALALVALNAYAAAGLTPDHLRSVQNRIADFEAFAKNYPEAMGMPGTARTPAPAEIAFEVLERGYSYQLSGGGMAQFVKNVQIDGTDAVTIANGTTTEELLAVLMDRVAALDEAVPAPENKDILDALSGAYDAQQRRMGRVAAERRAKDDSPQPGGAEDPNTTLVEQHGIEMIPCKSSNVEAYEYRATDNTLALRFKGGAIYHYAEVPPSVAHDLANAASIGSFANKTIVNKFDGTRMSLPASAATA